MSSIAELCKTFPDVDANVIESVVAHFNSSNSSPDEVRRNILKTLKEFQDEACPAAASGKTAANGQSGLAVTTIAGKTAYNQATVDTFVASVAAPRADGADGADDAPVDLERLFDGMNVGLEGVAPFVLCYHLQCAGPMSVEPPELAEGLRRLQLMPADAPRQLTEWGRLLGADKALYAHFFNFCFTFTLDHKGGRAVRNSCGEACDTLRAVLPVRESHFAFKKWEKLVGFLEANVNSLSRDLWRQVLRFAESIDDECSNYVSDEWSATIDDFVDNIINNGL